MPKWDTEPRVAPDAAPLECKCVWMFIWHLVRQPRPQCVNGEWFLYYVKALWVVVKTRKALYKNFTFKYHCTQLHNTTTYVYWLIPDFDVAAIIHTWWRIGKQQLFYPCLYLARRKSVFPKVVGKRASMFFAKSLQSFLERTKQARLVAWSKFSSKVAIFSV